MTESDDPKRTTEVRAEPLWYVRVSPHTGIQPAQRNTGAEAIVADISLGGLRLLSTAAFDRDELIEIEMVRPIKKNSVVGKKAIAVAQVIECSKLSPANGQNSRPRVNGKRISHQIRARFLSMDETTREWVRCVIAEHERCAQ